MLAVFHYLISACSYQTVIKNDTFVYVTLAGIVDIYAQTSALGGELNTLNQYLLGAVEVYLGAFIPAAYAFDKITKIVLKLIWRYSFLSVILV